jgi:hypothetical protein
VGVAKIPPVELLGVAKAPLVELVGVAKPPSRRANLGVLREPREGVENRPFEGVCKVRIVVGVDVVGIAASNGKSAKGVCGTGVGDRERRRFVLPFALGVT